MLIDKEGHFPGELPYLVAENGGSDEEIRQLLCVPHRCHRMEICNSGCVTCFVTLGITWTVQNGYGSSFLLCGVCLSIRVYLFDLRFSFVCNIYFFSRYLLGCGKPP